MTSPNCDSVLTDRFSKLWDSHEALITQDLDTDSAAISLGLVAHLLCLVSAILNLPIRHPFDLSEGYSRSTVVDQITPELADTARV